MKISILNKTLKNIIWMTYDRVFVLILNFFVTLVIANYYGKSIYGSYQYAISIVAIFGIFIEFNNARVLKKRFLSDDPDELVWNATVMSVIFSLITFFLGLIYSVLCKESLEYKWIFMILLFNSIILGLRFSMQSRFEFLLLSRKVILSSNIANIIGGLLQLLIVYLKKPIIYIAFIGSISAIINIIIIYFLYKKQFGKLISGKIKFGLIKQIFLESLPLSIGTACAIIYSKCDSVMIGNMISKSDVGVYSVALGFISVALIAIDPIRDSFYPRLIQLYNNDKNEYIKLYLKISAVLTWVSIIGILFSYIILPLVFKLYKPEYAPAFPIFCLYSINVIFMYNAGLRAGHFTMINKGKILMYSQIVSISINLLLNLFFIHRFGMYGAAIATAITQFISLYLSNLFWGKEGTEVLIWQIRGINPKYIFQKNIK